MTCSCCDFELTENSVFHITDSKIFINTFDLSPNAPFGPANVTIDGFPVSDLTLINGQYVADLSGIMDDITKCPCNDNAKRNRCTCHPKDHCNMKCDNDGHFFLAQVPGPWVLGATIVLEGTVSNGSHTCSFRLCMKTPVCSEGQQLYIPGSDNFALYCVEIPCQTGGIAPTLVFDFDACASLLNPELSVYCDCDSCHVTLQATLVLTPELHLQVTKPTLFNLNAAEVAMACDNVGQCDPCNPQEQCCCECEEEDAEDVCGCDDDHRHNHDDDHHHDHDSDWGCGCGGTDNTRDSRNDGCGCGCEERSESRSRQSDRNRNNNRGNRRNHDDQSCHSCNNFTAACQYCGTNGYSF